MKNIGLLFCVLVFFASCTPPTPMPTPTPINDPTVVPIPTKIPLPRFSATVVGYEDHGAMIDLFCEENCIGDEIDSIKVKVFQNGVLIENQPVEIIEKRNLVELQDSFYQLGYLEIEINYSGEKYIISDIEFSERYPFLRWIFGDYGLSRNVFGGFRDDHRGWDLELKTEEFPKSIGVPIFAISNGKMLINQIWNPYPDQEGYVTNIIAYLDDVGLVWQFGHVDAENPPVKTGTCGQFNSGDLVAKIGKKDAVSSAPHVHFGIQTLKNRFWHTINDHPSCTYVNPFSNNPFNEGDVDLPYGLFLLDYLPDEVKVAFDDGLFKSKTYVTDYAICLSTPGFSYKLDFPCDVK